MRFVRGSQAFGPVLLRGRRRLRGGFSSAVAGANVRGKLRPVQDGPALGRSGALGRGDLGIRGRKFGLSGVEWAGSIRSRALLFGRRSLRLGFGRRLSRLDCRICGPEVPTALWALPELLRRPRVFRPRVLQVHLAAAPLAAHADVWVVHGETDCSVLSK